MPRSTGYDDEKMFMLPGIDKRAKKNNIKNLDSSERAQEMVHGEYDREAGTESTIRIRKKFERGEQESARTRPTPILRNCVVTNGA